MHRSNSTFYVISLIVICIIATFFFSWKVTIPKYQKNELDLKKLEQEIITANAKLESLRVAKKDIEDLGSVFDQLFVAIPSDTDEPNVLSEIEAMAAANKLAVPSIQLGDSSNGSAAATTADTTAAGKITISFNVMGSFEDISQFTKAIENDLKIMNITNITLVPGDTGISASYQIEAFKSQNTQSLATESTGASTSLVTGN